jgi:tetratricopeptide (TPR) repeat protein/predicted Ser/Thr protein kinase
MLTPERWRKLEEIFERAADLPAAGREEVLRRECGEDAELRAAAAKLLQGDDSRGRRLAEVVEGVARIPPARGAEYLGRRIGSYRVVREIGRGGMGVVYEAERDDDEFRQRVALKVAARAAYAPEFLERFRHERQILAQLEHPNIARLLDGGATEDGIPYFAMEFVEGEPIQRYAERNGLSITERLRLFLQVCEAVEYAHQNLVIHRDLKPGNIFVAGGRVKLLDFGIAKLVDASGAGVTETGFAPLTPDYCSPEQFRRQAVTTRTDVYSLGLVLFELLTGKPGQKADTASPLTLERSVCEREIPRASEVAPERARELRGDLDTIVAAAVQKDAGRRYASAAALAEDVTRHLALRPIRARQASRWYRGGRFVRRHWLALAAAALLVLTLMGGVVAARREAARAERRFQQVRGLANTLLGDVHAAIRDLPASTKAQDVVVRTAVQYLDGLQKDAGGDWRLQWEVAQGYLRVAEIEYSLDRPSLNRPEAAWLNFEKARAMADELLRTHPHEARVAAGAGVVYGSRGNFLIDAGKTQEALASFERAIEIAEAGLRRHPQDWDLLDALREAQHSLVASHTSHPSARQHVRRYVEIAEMQARARPETAPALTNLALAYSQAAKVAHGDEDDELALAHLRRSVELQRRVLALEPENRTARRNLMLALCTLADVAVGPLGQASYTGSGGVAVAIDPRKRAEAQAGYESALEHARWNLEHDKGSDTARFDYAVNRGRMAVTYPPGDRRAILALEESLAMLKALKAAHGGSTARFELEFLGSLAERRRQAGAFREALASWRAVEAALAAWLAREPDAYYPRRIAISIYHNWAMELARRGDRAGARERAAAMVLLAEEVAAREAQYERAAGWPPRAQSWLAEVLVLAGDPEGARAARQRSRQLWTKVATRADLPEDLLREARKAAQ